MLRSSRYIIESSRIALMLVRDICYVRVLSIRLKECISVGLVDECDGTW